MRTALALMALAALAACARGGGSAPAASPSPTNPHIGFVRMEEVLKKHPLYAQLAQYDANISALSIDAVAPRAVAAGPDVARAQAALQAQLSAAAKHTDAVLQAKGKEYQQRENAAIAAALQAANAPGGTSVAGVAGSMEGTARSQVAGANAQARADLVAYQKQLVAQDEVQIVAMQKTLAARADRTYRTRADQINTAESALSLKLASDDAAERLSLRTKLSSLALDDAAREDAQKRIAALDRREADELAAQRNKDQPVLVALQSQLRTEVQNDMARQAAQIHAKSQERYHERTRALAKQFTVPAGPLIVTKVENGKPTTTVDPNLPPQLRQRIESLHADYAKAFQADAKHTIDDFNATRETLKRRYDALNGTDRAATQNAQGEIVSLQKKRDDLYGQMVAQIGREVKTIAQQRGISIVVSNIAAPAGGVDLTDDAMKDIETLHE